MKNKDKPKNRKQGLIHKKKLSDIKEFWKEKKPILLYVLIFAVLVSLFYAAYSNGSAREILFDPFIYWTTESSGRILNLIGYFTTTSGDTISTYDFSLGIRKGCDAIEPIALFICAILAFSGEWKNKLIGIISGTVILIVLNFIRIISLFWIGIKYPDWFDVMHVDVWQVIFIISAITLWMLWINSSTMKIIKLKSEKQ